MKRASSLQKRLGITLSVAVTALWLLAATVSGFVIRHEIDEVFDSALQETAQRLLPLAIAQIVDEANEARRSTVAPVAEHDEHLTYIVRDQDGNVLLHSHDAELGNFPVRQGTGFHETETHRIYAEAAISNTIRIEVAEPLGHRREATLEAAGALLWPLAGVVPLSIAAVWWLVGRALQPLRTFTDEIGARGRENLAPIAVRKPPAEIIPLAEAVNRLLDRLRRVLEAERRFSANSAHELRTPLAAALAQAQRLLVEAPGGPLRNRAERIESSLQQLSRIAEKLMQLAKAEGGGLLSSAPHDLAPVLAHVADELGQAPECRDRIRLHISQDDALSHLDPDAFGILIRNVIENALKHSPAATPVDVGLRDGTVHVINHGPALDPELLRGLTKPFVRGTAGATGSGLGLAIAEAIAAGSGCSLVLKSPARGRDDGFEAELHLPIARSAALTRKQAKA